MSFPSCGADEHTTASAEADKENDSCNANGLAALSAEKAVSANAVSSDEAQQKAVTADNERNAHKVEVQIGKGPPLPLKAEHTLARLQHVQEPLPTAQIDTAAEHHAQQTKKPCADPQPTVHESNAWPVERGQTGPNVSRGGADAPEVLNDGAHADLPLLRPYEASWISSTALPASLLRFDQDWAALVGP